jgi:hypothetical protein
MKKRKYLKPKAATIRFAAGEDVCIATGSGGTGTALSKGQFDSTSIGTMRRKIQSNLFCFKWLYC